MPDPGFGIDLNGDMVLHVFIQRAFTYDSSKASILPPEYRDSVPAEGLCMVIPESDVYQLGHLMWRIASCKTGIGGSDLCKMADCKIGYQSCVEPTHLPPLDPDTPEYLEQVIWAGRTENPYERPTAAQLLKMFPSDIYGSWSSTDPALDPKDSPVPDHDELGVCRTEDGHTCPPERPCKASTTAAKKKYMTLQNDLHMRCCASIAICDKCSRINTAHHFHCNICCSADFDICLDCFEKGVHCLDKEHYLLERREGDKVQRLYSSVKDDGKREMIVN